MPGLGLGGGLPEVAWTKPWKSVPAGRGGEGCVEVAWGKGPEGGGLESGTGEPKSPAGDFGHFLR